MRGIERSSWLKKRGRILQKMGVDSVESCGRSGANVHLWASFQMSKIQGEKRIVIVLKGVGELMFKAILNHLGFYLPPR